jgi:hypothetical protein
MCVWASGTLARATSWTGVFLENEIVCAKTNGTHSTNKLRSETREKCESKRWWQRIGVPFERTGMPFISQSLKVGGLWARDGSSLSCILTDAQSGVWSILHIPQERPALSSLCIFRCSFRQRHHVHRTDDESTCWNGVNSHKRSGGAGSPRQGRPPLSSRPSSAFFAPQWTGGEAVLNSAGSYQAVASRKKARTLQGGLDAWLKAGFPTCTKSQTA